MAVTQRRGPIGRVFHGILRLIRNYFILIGVLTTALWGLVLAMMLAPDHHLELPASHKAQSRLSEKHPLPLALKLRGHIAQREPDFSARIYERLFKSEHEIYLPELRATLRRASKDARIARLSISIGDLVGSPADFADLRRILADFAAGGKPIDATLNHIADWPYYVASAATKLTLSPAGEATLAGPAFSLTYFGEALRKVGVDIEVVRAGKYKSAFEPFVANQPSPDTVEEYESMRQSLLGHVLARVAEGRKKNVATVAGWYRRSIFTPPEALKEGIVDAVGYSDDELVDDDDDDDDDVKDGDQGLPISLASYAEAARPPKADAKSQSSHGGIALIEAVGEINLDAAGSRNSDDGITPDEMRRQLRWAQADDDVKAVVLRISSPGGSATASDMIWHDVKALAEAKPVVVSMGAYAASGGYYIAVAARKLIAEPTTVTGSIGVIGMLPNLAAFKEKYGVSFYTVSGSDRRNLLDLGSKPTPEDRAVIDQTIDHAYGLFKKRVADGRGLKIDDVEKLAQGRVYTGLQAKELGLVDDIGGLAEAFRAAKVLAGFDPEKLYPVLRGPGGELSLSQCLSSGRAFRRCLRRGGATAPALTAKVSRAWTAPEGGLVELEAEAADRARAWLSPDHAGAALALWPAYLGTKWR